MHNKEVCCLSGLFTNFNLLDNHFVLNRICRQLEKNYLAMLVYTEIVVFSKRVLSRTWRSSDLELNSIQELNNWLKYFKEYWYIGSTSAMVATTKYIIDPLVATIRYFSLADDIWTSVCSDSVRRLVICVDVTCNSEKKNFLKSLLQVAKYYLFWCTLFITASPFCKDNVATSL